ncbi:2-oxoacid dehydrogenases acyltransferase-domain-containing protein [Aspergillus unguis]
MRLRKGLSVASRHQSWFRPRWARVPGPKLLHSSPILYRVQPYLLADIGEGITECRVVQWFVKPGDRVGQFDAICEVQSDKASVEITSRYDGVVTAIHHEVDEMAIVGKPLLDIDIEDENLPTPEVDTLQDTGLTEGNAGPEVTTITIPEPPSKPETKHPGLATPAVRRIMKEHNIDIHQVNGTGKEGRVLKEDMLRHLSQLDSSSAAPVLDETATTQADETVRLSPTDSQMFKVMTKALSIPHFGYTHNVDLSSLTSLRRRVNSRAETATRLSALPFILKALSQTFIKFPKLNAHLDPGRGSDPPQLTIKHSHDIGIAVDTPSGLLVPVVKAVQGHSIISLDAEIKRLSALAKQGKLAPSDMRGATFTVSNIGSIGGAAVSPVIVPPMVAILGVGKTESVPVFIDNEQGESQIARRERAVLSWSADHRVLDGASVARCAESLAKSLESIDELGLALK